jgi:MFS family permease
LSVVGVVVPMLTAAGADRLAAPRSGPRPERLALVSALTASGVVVVGASMALTSNVSLALLLMCAWCGLMLAHNGPANGLLVSLVQPRMRGVVVGALQMMAAVMGMGLGPYVVGLLSDLYGGENSLRWAIVTGMTINVWAVAHFLLAAAAVRRDRASEDPA